ncbi:MAG: hypothetical protein V7603_5058 [Micromonosporaceae bacterium]
MAPMTVEIEVFPLAADHSGIWLVGGHDAWRPGHALDAGTTIHAAAESVLRSRGALDDLVALHSTSWRQAEGVAIHTYMAILAREGSVPGSWPQAVPVDDLLAGAVEKPFLHAATAPPLPRRVDVLRHALRDLEWGQRHLRFLLTEDDAVAATLDENWRRHLAAIRPALSNLYRHGERVTARPC